MRSAEFAGTSRFDVRSRVGAGGMGVVYEAYDRQREMRIAIKTLSRLDPAALYRFKNEFRSLADIVHDNLVRLHGLVCELATLARTAHTSVPPPRSAASSSVGAFTCELALDALDLHDARAVAAGLLDVAPDDPRVDEIAAESGGSPFFIGELARYAQSRTSIGGALRLEDVVESRLRALPPRALRLLEAVAAAGHPVDRAVAFRAIDLAPKDGDAAVTMLRAAHLLRAHSSSAPTCATSAAPSRTRAEWSTTSPATGSSRASTSSGRRSSSTGWASAPSGWSSTAPSPTASRCSFSSASSARRRRSTSPSAARRRIAETCSSARTSVSASPTSAGSSPINRPRRARSRPRRWRAGRPAAFICSTGFLAANGSTWAAGLGGLLVAGAASLRGDPARAVEALRGAVAAFDASSLALFATVARLRLGQVLGGDEGAALVAAAEAWLRDEGVRRPDRIAAMMAPGFRGAERKA